MNTPSIFLFDVGNVIIDADQNITFKILEQHGVSPENAKLFFSNEEYREFSRGNISGEEFYKNLIEKYLKHELSYDQIVMAHDKHIYGVNKEVETFLSSLPKERVAFATDTNTWQTAREKELIDLEKYGTNIFRSNELRRLKVDGGVFETIADSLKVKPDEILLVDDSPAKLEAARNIGIKTLLFENSESLSAIKRETEVPAGIPRGLH